ncbi:MAG: hypothetical protein OIF50_10145, partial [Flavobacteriaceae bacterium]|nr:hypothetical protein [Flavobacteriaceae bacterium]
RWYIYHNGLQVDELDYTGGPKAELVLLPEHAGSNNCPSMVLVELLDKHQRKLASVTFSLAATTQIEDVHWYNSHIDPSGNESLEEKQYGCLGDSTKIEVSGKGIYEVPMVLKIWDATDSGMPRFVLDSDPQTGVSVFRWPVKDPGNEDKTYYFTLHLGEKEVYSGKEQGPHFTAKAFVSPELQISAPQIPINPAYLYQEEFFTQRYELCGYSAIEIQHPSIGSQCIFEETKKQKTKAPLHHISVLTGNRENESLYVVLHDFNSSDCFQKTHQTPSEV